MDQGQCNVNSSPIWTIVNGVTIEGRHTPNKWDFHILLFLIYIDYAVLILLVLSLYLFHHEHKSTHKCPLFYLPNHVDLPSHFHWLTTNKIGLFNQHNVYIKNSSLGIVQYFMTTSFVSTLFVINVTLLIINKLIDWLINHNNWYIVDTNMLINLSPARSHI